ncbi:hypothetical protein [Polluticoccus soli]|uniref:hypothetical protein n=1 Tax=Polluticoccus soli TaxID=3034150 RepID=UPI0023E0DEDA|nr:hypothetical protein [Flavipsychrobacter sp. JY13-12]
MKPAITFLFLLLACTRCFAQAEDQVVFVNGKSFVLKRGGLNEIYSFQTLHETELFRLYPYYGADTGMVIYFVRSKNLGLLRGNTHETTVTTFIAGLQKTALIRDTTIDEQKEKAFISKHPLPHGYIPPQLMEHYERRNNRVPPHRDDHR